MLWDTGAQEKEFKESPLQMRRARRKGGKPIISQFQTHEKKGKKTHNIPV